MRHGTVQYLEARTWLNENTRGTKACARVLGWRPRHPKPEPVDLRAGVDEVMERILKRKYGLTRLKTVVQPAPHPTQCGAKTREGHPCRNKPVPGKHRCKFHGGMSTGPRTPKWQIVP